MSDSPPNSGPGASASVRRVLARLIRSVAPTVFRAHQLRRFQQQARLLDDLGRLAAEDIVITVHEYHGNFAMEPRSDLFRRLVLYGHYEPQLAATLEDAITELTGCHPEGFDAIDVGANIGFHSVLFLKSGVRRCLALEPVPQAHTRLLRNLERNGVLASCVAESLAAADVDGDASIEVIDGMEEYSALGGISHDAVAGRVRHRIPITTCRLDRLIKDHELEPRLIKIDAEGSEEAVLRGAESILRNFQPLLLVECNGAMKPSPLLPWLATRGYRFVDPVQRRWISPNTSCDDVLALPASMGHDWLHLDSRGDR